RYFIRRYGLEYLGSVESSPGKEPTPRYIAELIKKIKDNKVKSVFSETELPEASAKAVAEAAKVSVFQLDPLGGVKGRTNYTDIMLYNTEIFIKALK
ncbi:MAG: zinc ABC transporter substrate-binding protein, partial [Ignavibacteria bacterium]|nr:zinc ABC transporter substrate-binding protein [Ignavibacteria bacterium]